jgi:5,10-methenyltetrahydrofolate synthetase
MSKAELRQSLKQNRLAMTAEDVASKSHAIVGQLVQQIDWSSTRSLHLFEAIESLNEVQLGPLVQLMRTKYPQINLYTSQKINKNWEIVSLKTRLPVAEPIFNVIIVPMLGFDPKTLHRIGFGGGYYDKLLADQPQAKKIGVSYEQGKLELGTLSPEAHDIPLDSIITETTTYQLEA